MLNFILFSIITLIFYNDINSLSNYLLINIKSNVKLSKNTNIYISS